MYFFKPISKEASTFREVFHTYTHTKKIIIIAIFSCFAAIFQAAGGLLPGIGYLISPLATAPILLCCLFSISYGGLSYFLTILLLIIIEPTELIIFPFTTGLLGIGLGVAFYLFKRRITVIIAGSTTLTVGIISLLYIFQFPILGPVGSSTFSFLTTGAIFIFSFLYSWLWVEIGVSLMKRLKIILN